MIIHICIGSSCYLKGSYKVIHGLEKKIQEHQLGEQVTIKGAFCLGECTKAVSVRIDEGPILSVNEENLDEFFNEQVLRRS